MARQRGVGPPAVGVGAQGQPDQRQVAQERQAAPWIQAPPADHEVVGLSGLSLRCSEDHLVAQPTQDLPADRHLGRIEVECGEGRRTRAMGLGSEI
jgi:hypothetical protein